MTMTVTEQNWISKLPDGRHALYLDNTLLSSFWECEAKFNYRHVEHLAPKGTAEQSASMWLGSWWSRTMENFYRQVKAYQDREISVEPSEKTVVAAASEAWVASNMGAGTTPEANSFQEIYAKVYDKFRGTEGAVRMALDYWEHFGEHDLRNWKIISTELAFGLGGEVLVGEDHELVLYWCGKPDVVAYEQELDNLVPVDHKTEEYLKSNFIQKWKPHGQTAGYIFALNKLCHSLGYDRTVDRCIINGAARMVVEKPRKDTPRPRFLRARVHYNGDELVEWQRSVFGKAKRLLKAYVSNEWTRADSMICHLFSGCIYRGLDNQPPGVAREAVLRTGYTQIEPWVPYQKTENNGDED
jgi:hypothetical protein